MRYMACTMTADQVVARAKTVTRRKGWQLLGVGDRLQLVKKSPRHLSQGEPLERLAVVEVVSVERQPLAALLDPARNVWAKEEIAAEGFPQMSPTTFVDRFFVQAQGMSVDQVVTRIQWRYLDEDEAAA